MNQLSQAVSNPQPRSATHVVYAREHRVPEYLLLGWMFADRYPMSCGYSVVMCWPCACQVRWPR